MPEKNTQTQITPFLVLARESDRPKQGRFTQVLRAAANGSLNQFCLLWSLQSVLAKLWEVQSKYMQMSVDPPRCRVACIYQNNRCFLSLFKRCHLTSLRCASFVFLDINLGIRLINNYDYNLMLYAINYFVFHNQYYFSFIYLVL